MMISEFWTRNFRLENAIRNANVSRTGLITMQNIIAGWLVRAAGITDK